MSKTIAIIGAGSRGQGFANMFAARAPRAKVNAVAEPRDDARNAVVKANGIKPENTFGSWQDFVKKPRLADAVFIGTMDRDHAAPAIACMKLGYDILLEKPMAVTLQDCQQIEAAQRQSGVIFGVCHSLRYQKGFRKVKEVLDSGIIGRPITINLTEQVAWWHQAHSFVRGNWGNEGRSTFMLLAKSCHDIDYLHYLIGRRCLCVSSFGSLTYFRPEHAPPGAGDRCVQCDIERQCHYSALKHYLNTNRQGWPAGNISHDHSYEAHFEALKTGPFGRCVWKCDNDVVDHQTVNMLFEDEVTAVFTMTAFTKDNARYLRVHGTLGEIIFDEQGIRVNTFADNNTTTIQIGRELGGHGGGDDRIVDTFIEALYSRDDRHIVANAQESLKTHTVVFAAEKSRRENRTIRIAEMVG